MNKKDQARATLFAAGITSTQSFDSLTHAQREAIAIEASEVYQAKYGKPMPDDRTRLIRKRFNLLQQRARS